MLLHTPEGRVRFTDPTRQPGQLADVLRGRLAGPVVVATGAAAAAGLLPGLSVPATRTLTTYYHAAPPDPPNTPRPPTHVTPPSSLRTEVAQSVSMFSRYVR